MLPSVEPLSTTVIIASSRRAARHRVETGQRVVAAVPVDDDDVDGRRAQDEPPMRRLMRSRNERGCSGTCSVAANASFCGSMRGARTKSTSGCERARPLMLVDEAPRAVAHARRRAARARALPRNRLADVERTIDAGAVSRQQFVGARRAARHDRQSAPEVVVDARPHREIGLDRLRERQQRRAEAAVERARALRTRPTARSGRSRSPFASRTRSPRRVFPAA